MSQLSEREIEAGISRNALETFNRTNGRARKLPAESESSLEKHLESQKLYNVSSPIKLAVVDTWERSLALLNRDGWNFTLRDTQHLRALSCVTITLTRNELEMLGQRIAQALAEKGE